MVTAIVALFVAVDGVGLAASQLPKNTVGPKQIKADAVRAAEIQANAVGSAEVGAGAIGSGEVLDEALTGGDLQDGTVGGADVQDESLGSGEISDGSLNGGDLQDDSVGSADVQGLTAGDVQADTFVGGSVTVQHELATADLADGTSSSYNAFCPAGQQAIAGGFRGDFEDSEATNTGSSRPSMSPGNTEPPLDNGTYSGWRITVDNPAGGVAAGIRPEVWAICAAVP
jgi:hypothetical protein